MENLQQLEAKLAEVKQLTSNIESEIAKLKNPEFGVKERWQREYDNFYIDLKRVGMFAIKSNSDAEFGLIHDQCRLMTELQTFAKLRNGDWVADWGNDEQKKHGLKLVNKKCDVLYYLKCNYLVYGISFKSHEIATEALEIFGERIEQFYGK